MSRNDDWGAVESAKAGKVEEVEVPILVISRNLGCDVAGSQAPCRTIHGYAVGRGRQPFMFTVAHGHSYPIMRSLAQRVTPLDF